MAGAEQLCYIAVIPGTLVLVAHEKRDGGAGRLSLEYSGEYLYRICLISLCRIFALAGFPAVKELLDVRFGKRKPGGTSVDHNTDTRTVGFAPLSLCGTVCQMMNHS